MKTILVPLDGSPLAERALPYATSIARATRARLILVRATEARTFPGADSAPAQIAVTSRAEADLARTAELVRSEGVEVEPHVYYDDAPTAILDAARRHQADLIVMSTHGRSGLGRLVRGSVAEAVSRQADRPVMLVPAAAAPSLPADPLGLARPRAAEQRPAPAASPARAVGMATR